MMNFSLPMSDTVTGPNGVVLIPVGMHPEEAKLAADGKGVVILWGRLEYATIYSPKTTIENGICFLMIPIKPQQQVATPASPASPAGPPPIPAITRDNSDSNSSDNIVFYPKPYRAKIATIAIDGAPRVAAIAQRG